MSILSTFPSDVNSSDVFLDSVSNISVMSLSGQIFIRWSDPNDVISSTGKTLMMWYGTLLVRKEGSFPANRYDGTVVADSRTRNAYQDSYFCDSGLTNGVTYYYKFFPYSTTGIFTDSEDDTFTAVPKSLNDTTWGEIDRVCQLGIAPNVWSVGDRKAVAINGTIGTLSVNSTYYVYILGFAHHGATNTVDFGTFKTALTGGADICLCDDIYGSISSDGAKYFNLNHWGESSTPYNTNYGGWKGCDARYDILGSTNQAPSGYGSTPTTSRVGYNATATTATNPVANTLMAALPADLRAVMKPMTIYTDNNGNSSNIQANVTTSVDYLPLLSEFEIFGKINYANQYEQNHQEQYQYYKSGNSRVKNQHDGISTNALWWERSPNYNGATNFCFVNVDGNANSAYSRASFGLAPAFRV